MILAIEVKTDNPV